MSGLALFTITAITGVAQQEVENISANTKKGIAMKMSRGEKVGFARALGYNYDPETKTISITDRIAGAGRGDGGVLPCEPGLSAAGRNRIQPQGKEGFTDNGLFPASLVRIPFSDWHTGLGKKGRYKCSDPGYSIIH